MENSKEYLKDELERLNRINKKLESGIEITNPFNLGVVEQIQKNTLAMCEIAKAL